jgi:hypothetical protein
MNRARLEHLLTVLDCVPEGAFQMDNWVCGTTACAIGWAAQDSIFKEEGLTLMFHTPQFNEASGFYAVENFFDISVSIARALFAPESYRQDVNFTCIATPADVAARVRELLASEATS